MFSSAAARGRKRTMVSSWKLDSSTTKILPGGPSTTAASGRPMLPQTSTAKPAPARSAPVIAVVVDLPLLPVMPTTVASEPCEERPGELDLRDDRQRAAPRPARSSGWSSPTPGLTTRASSPAGSSGRVIGKPELDARISGQIVHAELVGGATVARHHGDATTAQQPRRRGAGQAEPEDEDALEAGGIEGRGLVIAVSGSRARSGRTSRRRSRSAR